VKHIEQAQTDKAAQALSFLASRYKSWGEVVRDVKDGVAETIEAYNDIKSSLAGEQHSICCYCENTVSIESIDSNHIEHIRPRDKDTFQEYEFDYTNLAHSCNGGFNHNLHCGHHKANVYDESLFVSPHDANIDGLFKYTADGDIWPGDAKRQSSAEHMKDSLRLDCVKLTNMRKSYGRPLQDAIEDFLNDIDMLTEFARPYLLPDPVDDQYQYPFISLSRQILGPVIAGAILGPTGE
jgi:uncharacterized protein (TIGR02646 family)